MTALIFTLLLPPSTPLWQAAMGASIGIVLGKLVFGGIGRNFLNPAVVGLAYLAVAHPDGGAGASLFPGLAGGGVPSPVERNLLSHAEQASGVRLACQVRSRGGIEVRVPPEAFGVKTRTCRVRSARGLTPFIREIVLALPPGERLEFRAGAFVSITAPPHRLRLGDLPAAAEFPAAWDAPGLRDLVGETDRPVQRAYSLANHPGEPDVVRLDVRLALPPPGRPGVPPGVVSTWLFSLQEGDEVTVEGPFGHFLVEEGDSELVFIGGGVGMAPLRRGCSLAPPGEDRACGGCESGCARRAAGSETTR